MFLVHYIEVAQDLVNIRQEERISTGRYKGLLNLVSLEFGEKFT